MWLYRGAQSAVFYYATCTPCAMSIDRRKRKNDAARTQRKQQRYDLEVITDQPRPFPQPTPFSTNEGWREEIALGPGPPTRRGGNRNPQRTNSWNTDQSSQLKDKSGSLMHPLGERWSRMRYQREDEPLWGQEQEVRGSSIGFSGSGPADREPKYYTARAPPVNDLHPPIVSGPISRAETRWMLQPPPSARVMEGKTSFANSPRDSVGGFPGDRLSRVLQHGSRRNEIAAEQFGNDGALDTESFEQNLPRRPSVSRGRERSNSFSREDFEFSRHSRSDSMFSLAHSDDLSPSASWKYPDTPETRRASKSIDESDKAPRRPQISKTLSTLQRPDNKHNVHLYHLEINDDHDDHDEVGLGQLERIRPWRWSMDI